MQVCHSIRLFFRLRLQALLVLFLRRQHVLFIRPFWVVPAVCCIFGGVSQLGAQEADSLKQRLVVEAPQKWEAYQAFAQCLQGKMTKELLKRNPKGELVYRMYVRHEIKQNQKCALFLSQPQDENKTKIDDDRTKGSCAVDNPMYVFELERGNSKRDWLLGRLNLRKREGKPTTEGTVQYLVNSWVLELFSVDAKTLASLVKEKNFRVASVGKVRRDNRDLIQVEFENPHPVDPKRYTYPVQAGSLLLDPLHYWCLVEYNIKTQYSNGTGTIRKQYEFKEGTNGFPILTRSHEVHKSTVTPNTMDSIGEFDLHEATKLPGDDDFTLSAFGLPEPMGAEPLPPSRTWIWLLAAAIAAAAIAMLFAWLKRRHTRTASRSSPTS